MQSDTDKSFLEVFLHKKKVTKVLKLSMFYLS